MTKRNIFNQEEIVQKLNEIIEYKNLNEFDHIKKWLLSNVKNYFIKNAPIKEVSFDKLNTSSQAVVSQKNILSPYHHIVFDSNHINEIHHMIDYFKNDSSNKHDISRLSYSDGLRKANQWVSSMVEDFSDEDDSSNVIPLHTIHHHGKQYTWVNLRSKKALQRESKMMVNCIASQWDESMEEGKPSCYFSLRDEKNIPVITLKLKIDYYSTKKGNLSFLEDHDIAYSSKMNSLDNCQLNETNLIDIRRMYKEYKKHSEESAAYKNSLNSYIILMNQYSHPDTPDNIIIDIYEAKQKYNECLAIENSICVTKFIKEYFIPKINENFIYNLKVSDASSNIWTRNNELLSFNDIIKETEPQNIRPNQSFFDLVKFYSPRDLLRHCIFNDVHIKNNEFDNSCIYAKSIIIENVEDKQINTFENTSTKIFNSNTLDVNIPLSPNNENYFVLENVSNTKLLISINPSTHFKNKPISLFLEKKYLILNKNSSNNTIKIKKSCNKFNNKIMLEYKDDHLIYIINYKNKSNSFINESPLPLFILSIDKNNQISFYKKDSILKHQLFSYDILKSTEEHFGNIIKLMVNHTYQRSSCIEKEILSHLKIRYISEQNEIKIGSFSINTSDFFNDLIFQPHQLVEKILDFSDNYDEIFNHLANFKQKIYHYLDHNPEHILARHYFTEHQIYKEKIENIFAPIKEKFKKELNEGDDLALGNFFNQFNEFVFNNDIIPSLAVFEYAKNSLIEICRSIGTPISNGILSGAQTKIRKTRRNNIIQFIMDCYSNEGFSKNELEIIFENDFRPQSKCIPKP